MIEDENIPTADPEMLIKQYEPLLYKISGKYRTILDKYPDIDEDDLLQAGRIVIHRCQSCYDPEQASFTTFIYDRCRAAMRNVIGYHQDGSLPETPVSLDKALPGDTDEITLMDTIPDPGPGPDVMTEEADEKERTALAVREAVDRLKNEQQREAIRRIWLDEQPRAEAACEMGISKEYLYSLEMGGKRNLRRLLRMNEYVMPFFLVGAKRFQSTWTSSVEKSVLWLESYRNRLKNLTAEESAGE